MTSAAKAFGKRIDNFMLLKETREYVEALSLLPGIPGRTIETLPGSHAGT